MADRARELPDSFTVGEWSVDRHSLTISSGGETRQLEPRAFGVLRHLAERPGQLVTIDELMDALWPDVVVTPNAVTRVIAQLRKALGDEAKHPRYIQTVARSGYRLVAPVATAGPSPLSVRRLPYVAAAGALILFILLFALLQRHDATEGATVAVLPFENYTGDESLVYLGEGVAEGVIDALAQLPELRVSARSLSFTYPDAGVDPLEFAARLGVRYLVEGSVRQSGGDLRLTAQLISADDGYHLWSRTAEYDRLQMFEAQDAIANGVVEALGQELGIDVPVVRVARRTPDPEAWDLYLRGRHVWHRRGNEPMRPAVEAFSEAVRIDPEFARGWAALASAYLSWPSYSSEGNATWRLAEDAAERARKLDPDIPEVYGTLGTFAERRLEWVKAHDLFVEGVRRDDRSATAHYWLSEHLAKTGRYRDSLRHIRRALELDPTYIPPKIDTGFAELMFGDLEAGAARFEDGWASGFRNPTSWIGYFISRILIGEFEAAAGLVDDSPFNADQKALLQRFVDVEAGNESPAALIDELFPASRPPFDHRFLVWLGSRLEAHDKVLALLQYRLEQDWWIDPRPIWGPATHLHGAPGFVDFVRDLGLVEYWEQVAWSDYCRPRHETIVCDRSRMIPAAVEASD